MESESVFFIRFVIFFSEWKKTLHNNINAFEDLYARNEVQPMWLWIFFTETFENAPWRKVEQMQPVWLCILWFKQLEGTSENTHWRKVK